MPDKSIDDNSTCKDSKDRESCASEIAHSAVKKKEGEKPNEETIVTMDKAETINEESLPSKVNIVRRMLNQNMSDLNFVQRDDGSLIVHNVVLLAPGTWTDSLARTPCRYKKELLGKCATNWDANGLWTRHAGGNSRSVTDKIGLARMPRQDPATGNIVGDLWYHCKTQNSRDTAEMVKAGIIDAVSVEMDVRETFNPAEQVYDAVDLTFTGVAHVDQGACTVCKVPKRNNEKYEQNDINKTEVTMNEEPEVKKELSDLDIFKADVEKQNAITAEQLKTLSAELESTKQELEKSKQMIAEKDVKNNELNAKVVALENLPDPKTLAPEVTATVIKTDMEVPKYPGKLPRIDHDSVICE